MISKTFSFLIVVFYIVLIFLMPEQKSDVVGSCIGLAFFGLLLVWFADYMEYVVGWFGHSFVDGFQPAIIIQILGWIIIVFLAPILYLVLDCVYF